MKTSDLIPGSGDMRRLTIHFGAFQARELVYLGLAGRVPFRAFPTIGAGAGTCSTVRDRAHRGHAVLMGGELGDMARAIALECGPKLAELAAAHDRKVDARRAEIAACGCSLCTARRGGAA